MLCVLFTWCSTVPHLYVRVLSARPLGGERQIQKVHQVVVAIGDGFKFVICLNHLEHKCWDKCCFSSNKLYAN